MTFSEKGFLAKDEWNILESNAKEVGIGIFALLETASAYAWQLQYSLNADSQDTVQHMRLAAYAKTITTVQAAIILLRLGMAQQGEVLARVAWEAVFLLAALTNNPGVARRVMVNHYRNRNNTITLALENEVVRASILENVAALESKVAENLIKIQESGGVGIKVHQLAKEGGLTPEHIIFYSSLSNAIHTNVSDLERHVDSDGDGEIIGMSNQPDFHRSAEVATMLAQALSTAIIAIDDLNGEAIKFATQFRIDIQKFGLFAS